MYGYIGWIPFLEPGLRDEQPRSTHPVNMAEEKALLDADTERRRQEKAERKQQAEYERQEKIAREVREIKADRYARLASSTEFLQIWINLTQFSNAFFRIPSKHRPACKQQKGKNACVNPSPRKIRRERQSFLKRQVSWTNCNTSKTP